MYIIAGNISTRRPAVKRLFSQIKTSGWDVSGQPAHVLSDMASRCAAAGAPREIRCERTEFEDSHEVRGFIPGRRDAAARVEVKL